MSRIRKANERAIEKTLHFLTDLQLKCEGKGYIDFTFTEMQQRHNISKSTYSICRKLNFIGSRGQWLVGSPQREMALQILEVLRQQASKRIDVALSSDFETALERLTTSMNTLSLQNEKSLKSPLLSRALNQVEQNPGNHLFSKVENDESKKFELLQSIASGWYAQYDHLTPYQNVNDSIILATEDLFNKFFKK